MNKQRGITLISLVVTIIILLILATVSILMILGAGGTIAKSKESKVASRYAEINDKKNKGNTYY